MKTYNVYVVRYSDDTAVAKFASNVPERKIDNCVMMGLTRVNSEHGVYAEEVGSENDLKYQNDLSIK